MADLWPEKGSEPSRFLVTDVTPERADGGTHGFLFADLRGYTRLVDSQGATEASHLLERYRLLTRDVVSQYGGAEIKTEGDSFYVVLPSASAALRCGLALLSACQDPPDGGTSIPVGIGIHAGEAVAHEGGFVGSAVNIAARLSAEAGSGQLLTTATIRELTRSVVDARFVPLGRRSLKGLADPVDVYRVEPTVAAGKRSDEVTRRIGLGGSSAVSRRQAFVSIAAIGLVAVLGIVGLSWIARSPSSSPGRSLLLSPAAPTTSTASRPPASLSATSAITSAAPTYAAAPAIGLDPLPLLAWQSSDPTFSPVLSPPVISPDGRVWVASGKDGDFWIFDPHGNGPPEVWGAPGNGDDQFDFVYRGNVGAGEPYGGIAFGADGSFWVADTGNFRVDHFDRNRSFVGSWGGFGSVDEPGKFSKPTAIGVDAAGLVYVLDAVRHDVQVFDSGGQLLNAFAVGQAATALYVHPTGSFYVNALPNGGPGLTEYGPDASVQGAVDVSALVGNPTGISVDSQRDIFVGSSDRLARFGTGGDPQLLWPNGPDRLWPVGAESIAVTQDASAVYVTSRVSPYLREYLLQAGAAPSASAVAPVLPIGYFSPGTYSTNFQPALSFTLDGNYSHAEAYADQQDFVDFSFGQNPMLELFVNRADQVLDPNEPGSTMAPPPDLAAWIAKLSGLTVVTPPMDVKVGGLDGKQLDVLGGDSDISFGPGAVQRRHLQRFIVVSVAGHEVLITFLAQEESSAHFNDAVTVFQPVIDSIVWN